MTREEINRRLCELLKICPHDEGVICEDDEWFCELCGEPCEPDDAEFKRGGKNDQRK